jgi:vesicle transport through interaction with t-SNAREs protein 1
MDLEARSLQPSVKAGLLAKLREYKSDLSSVKSEVKRVSAPNAQQATREELLEAGMSDTLAVSSILLMPVRMNSACSRPAI